MPAEFQLFAVPFAAGLALAVLLPVLGCYLRLRDEWLAALAYAHVAAAGALAAAIAGLPALPGGIAAAGMAGAAKRILAQRLSGSASHALLLLAGWAAAVLLTANQPLAERLGHALFDGQLYFADVTQLVVALAAATSGAVLLHRLARPLLLVHVYPDFHRLRGQSAWPVQSGFDLLAALLLALATTSLGVMGAFALVFVPPWLAFRRGRDWGHGIRLAALIGIAGYVAAFALALTFDQPFGPVLALVLLAVGLFIA